MTGFCEVDIIFQRQGSSTDTDTNQREILFNVMAWHRIVWRMCLKPYPIDRLSNSLSLRICSCRSGKHLLKCCSQSTCLHYLQSYQYKPISSIHYAHNENLTKFKKKKIHLTFTLVTNKPCGVGNVGLAEAPVVANSGKRLFGDACCPPFSGGSPLGYLTIQESKL